MSMQILITLNLFFEYSYNKSNLKIAFSQKLYKINFSEY
jgi:hypothetical protein